MPHTVIKENLRGRELLETYTVGFDHFLERLREILQDMRPEEVQSERMYRKIEAPRGVPVVSNLKSEWLPP
jgi:hypothetical protein